MNCNEVLKGSFTNYVMHFLLRVSISGKIECIGCQLDHYHKSGARAVDTLFALFLDSVSTLTIEQSQVEAPLR